MNAQRESEEIKTGMQVQPHKHEGATAFAPPEAKLKKCDLIQYIPHLYKTKLELEQTTFHLNFPTKPLDDQRDYN